jgi:hypothetical protein
VVPQGFVVLFPVVLGGDFRSPLLVFFLVCFRDLALGDLMGKYVGFASGELLDSCVFGSWCCWLVLGLFGVDLLGFV